MPKTGDRARETTTTTGTGAITLAGAVAQFQSFAAAVPGGGSVMYAIVGQSGTEWEVGKGTFDGTTGLTRDVVRSSSNANALVNLSAGTKDVILTLTAELADNANFGLALSQIKGWALP